MRPSPFVAIVCVALLATPLAGQANDSTRRAKPDVPARAAPLPSVTLPPALDRVLRDYERGWRAGDASALAALFTSDGLVLQGGRPPVRGTEAIRRAYSDNRGSPLNLRALHYEVDGSVGFIIGAYGYGETGGDVGKFTLTLRRSPDGRWLIVSDMDNGSPPPRP